MMTDEQVVYDLIMHCAKLEKRIAELEEFKTEQINLNDKTRIMAALLREYLEAQGGENDD